MTKEGTITTRTQPAPAPAWAAEYRQFAVWTHDELRNLLCGLPPVAPADALAPTRQQIADDYVRDELRRVAADRHVRDAVLAGHLKVLEPPDERLLEKIKLHLTPEEFEAVRRALAHDRTCAKAYRVAPEAAIRWAASHPDWFPDFPFPAGDRQPPSEIRAFRAGVSKELKAHRRALIRQVLNARDVTQKEFLKQHDLNEGTLRGMVNGDRRRCGPATESRVLKLLDITERDWNTLP
jgi:hypothetical protein